MKIKIALLGIVSLLFLPATNAQVTIGSDVLPRKGTLLDLKQDDNKKYNANSKKGFGLPRVALSSLTTLTVDVPANANDYVGITVYNTTNNSQLSEGTYCWFGTAWRQVVLVDDAGTNGKLLKSNGNDTFYWSTITIPEYDYWKPTQRATFETSKSFPKNYDYPSVVSNDGNPSLYANHFVYIDKLHVKSDATVRKFLLLEVTANITKRTNNNKDAVKSYWEQMQVDVFVNDEIVKTYERTYSSPENTVANTLIDLFSIVPLDDLKLSEGEYIIKVRISNIKNSYKNNYSSTNSGYFGQANPFLEIALANFGFILYEGE